MGFELPIFQRLFIFACTWKDNKTVKSSALWLQVNIYSMYCTKNLFNRQLKSGHRKPRLFDKLEP